jgi:hypothetical protein
VAENWVKVKSMLDGIEALLEFLVVSFEELLDDETCFVDGRSEHDKVV